MQSFTLSLLISLVMYIGTYTSHDRQKEFLPFTNCEISVNGITYRIDPRIELFNIVAMQFGHSGMTLSNIPYKKESLDYFEPYSNHPAPQILMQTWQKGWHVDDPMFFLLHLDEQFNIKKGLHPDLIKRGGGMEQLQKLADALKDYAENSDFYTYFNTVQHDFYKQILSQTAYHYRNFSGANMLESYYGEKADSYTLILNLISGYGNFGTSIRTEDRFDLYAIVETNAAAGDLPVFKPSVAGIDLILHEFSHGFVNPHVDKYKAELSEFGHLYQPIEESMKSQGYHYWQVTVNEHIVRSNVIRMIQNERGASLAKALYYKREMGRRFIYLDAILDKVQEFESNRGTYPTFKTFVPELLSVFSEVSEPYIKAKQQKVEEMRKPRVDRLPKPYDFAKDSSTVFVIGTHEQDKESQQGMHLWVEQYRNMFSPDIRIITDNEALQMDLYQSDIVLFGTKNGNAFLSKYIDQIPVIITDTEIVTNTITKGTDLQLVTSWVSPFNNEKTLAIYTAQQTEDIKNFNNSPVKDQYHYWIAKDLITLDKGDYVNHYWIWTPDIF